LTTPSSDIERVRAEAECLASPAAVQHAIDQLAVRLALRLDGSDPLVLCVMNGGLILTAELLLRLHFPLEVGYLHATRYRDGITGGTLHWHAKPGSEVRGRTVLVVDDVLDVGTTLAAVVAELARLGAARVVTSVLIVKDVEHPTRIRVDEAALHCPDRYLFGHGMDYRGHWRNLAGIYALPLDWQQ
jgi:hypoxanthine phosphoribosyltransferase